MCLPFYARKVSRHYRPCPVFSFIGRRLCSYFIHLHYHLGMLSSAITQSTGSDDNQEVSQGLDSGRPASYTSSSVVVAPLLHTQNHFTLSCANASWSGQRVLAMQWWSSLPASLMDGVVKLSSVSTGLSTDPHKHLCEGQLTWG